MITINQRDDTDLLANSFVVQAIHDFVIMAEPSHEILTENQDGELDDEKRGGKQVSLERTLGVPGGIALLVGTIIGSGIFATPKWVLFYVGSVGMSLVIWALCGVISMFGALCYSELGTLIPKSGGEFQYLLEAYGSLPAFLFSWIFVLFMRPAGQIMVLLVFGTYVVEAIFPGCGGREDLVPLVKILAAAAMGKWKVCFDFDAQLQPSSYLFKHFGFARILPLSTPVQC